MSTEGFVISKFMNRCFVSWPDPVDYPLMVTDSLGREIIILDRRIPCPNGCGTVSFDQRFKRNAVWVDLYYCERCDQYSAVKTEEQEKRTHEAITED